MHVTWLIIIIFSAEGCQYDGERYEELTMVPLNQSHPCEACFCYVRFIRWRSCISYNIFYRMKKLPVKISLSLVLNWNATKLNKLKYQINAVYDVKMVRKVFTITWLCKPLFSFHYTTQTCVFNIIIATIFSTENPISLPQGISCKWYLYYLSSKELCR